MHQKPTAMSPFGWTKPEWRRMKTGPMIPQMMWNRSHHEGSRGTPKPRTALRSVYESIASISDVPSTPNASPSPAPAAADRRAGSPAGAPWERVVGAAPDHPRNGCDGHERAGEGHQDRKAPEVADSSHHVPPGRRGAISLASCGASSLSRCGACAIDRTSVDMGPVCLSDPRPCHRIVNSTTRIRHSRGVRERREARSRPSRRTPGGLNRSGKQLRGPVAHRSTGGSR
jgi:hypothetical protein